MRQPVLEKLAGLLGKANAKGKARIFEKKYRSTMRTGAAGVAAGGLANSARALYKNKKAREHNEGLAEGDPDRKKIRSIGKSALKGAGVGGALGLAVGGSVDKAHGRVHKEIQRYHHLSRKALTANRDSRNHDVAATKARNKAQRDKPAKPFNPALSRPSLFPTFYRKSL